MTTAPSMPSDSAERSAGQASDLSLEHARQAIAARIQPISGTETLGLRDAMGRILAHDLLAPIDVPAYDNSAMDGFAVRTLDLHSTQPTRLRAVGEARAGSPWLHAVKTGEAVRVMTGAMLPSGADAVVVQEQVIREQDAVWIPPGVRAGQHCRPRGEDLRQGQPALAAGRILRPADLGLLASMGVAQVTVRRRLRVAFCSTGDELRSVGEPLEPGMLYDSNRHTLFGMLSALGVELIDLGVIGDSPEALIAGFERASLQADAIVSSGGVSVGDADYTRQVMARLGEVAFWRLAIRPGRPMAFGRIGQAAYFGLPGNPVAVMVTFWVLVRDALLAQAGATPTPALHIPVRSLCALSKRPGRTEFLRAVVTVGSDGQLDARTTDQQGSGMLRSMSQANALLVLSPETTDVGAGDWVPALLLDRFA